MGKRKGPRSFVIEDGIIDLCRDLPEMECRILRVSIVAAAKMLDIDPGWLEQLKLAGLMIEDGGDGERFVRINVPLNGGDGESVLVTYKIGEKAYSRLKDTSYALHGKDKVSAVIRDTLRRLVKLCKENPDALREECLAREEAVKEDHLVVRSLKLPYDLYVELSTCKKKTRESMSSLVRCAALEALEELREKLHKKKVRVVVLQNS